MSPPLDLIVIGGGEHARVLIEAARSRADLWNVVGFVDPLPCEDTARRLGVRRLGDDATALSSPAAARFVVGVGSIGVSPLRATLVERYRSAGVHWASVVHSRATVSETAVLGEGVVIFAGAVVNSGANLGDHSVVNTGAIIEHDVTLGAFAQLGPGAIVGGGASIGASAYLGLGCRVRDHLQIGAGSLVGMGAVVVGPVGPNETVVGVPARRVERSR